MKGIDCIDTNCTTRLVLVGSNTNTVRIHGISAADTIPDAMVHKPSADLEIVEYGHPVQAQPLPVVRPDVRLQWFITRAVRELLEVDSERAGPLMNSQ